MRRIWTALVARLEPTDPLCTCTALAEVVFLLGYIGTVFLYRLIFIRFYAAASEEVQARSCAFPSSTSLSRKTVRRYSTVGL